MAQGAVVRVDTSRDIGIDSGVMAGRGPAARRGGWRPGKKVGDMTAMSIGRRQFVPMAGQTRSRVSAGGNDVSHRLGRGGLVAGQTLRIVAGGADSAGLAVGMDDFDASPGKYRMAIGAGLRITSGDLALVSWLNRNAMRMGMAIKEGSMTGDTLAAACLAGSATSQRTIDWAVAEIAAQTLMDFTAADKGRDGC